MDLFEKFFSHVKQQATYQNKLKLLLAVSGGIDSVVLCDLVNRAGFDFFIVHCNFKLRGEESEGDELFVRELAKKYNKEIIVESFETEKYAEEKKLSIQEAARELRYRLFASLTSTYMSATTTAHHADDNIETVVMNFFRGTGIKGLTGMNEGLLVYRPLLPFRKKEILEYATQNNLSYREDSSNASNKYIRNFFRNDLLPSIKKVFPAAEENILHNIARLTEVEQVYEQAIKEHKERLIVTKKNEEHIAILKLKKTHPLKTILWEILRERYFTAGQVDEVIKLMDADNGSYITSESHRVIKNRRWLIITKRHHYETNEHYIIDPGEKNKRVFEKEKLLIEKKEISTDFKIPTSSTIACLDADKITFPLLLRKWKQGDYFYPLGMRKKKKLSKFFIDLKLSLTDKEKVWVLEMNKKIIWVVGYRIDDRFKIELSTKSVLKITSTEDNK